MQGLIGKKIGMTRIFDAESGEITPVTIIETGKNVVIQTKTIETDGYTAVQLGFEKIADRKLTKAELGHTQKNGAYAVRYIREFALDVDESLESGQEIGADLFEAVRYVDVTGTTKGRGFAGTVKKYGFKIGRATHGNTNRRARGSLGAGSSPSRVFPGLKMAGQYGNVNKTIRGVQVVAVDADKDLIYVRGAIPGKTGGVVYVKKNVIKG